jgi:hypothetical protein
MLKSEIRILGFDDGAFQPHSNDSVPVIGVIFRGGKFLDGALKTDITVDGIDATEKIVKLINSTRHKKQLKVLMFDGITLGGFNIVDVKKVYEETRIPVIVINRKHPDLKKVKEALKNFEDFDKRWEMILNAGEIKKMRIKESKDIFYQSLGLTDEQTQEIIELSTTRSFIPEPLRVAHLIVTAVVRGESYGRA